MATDEIKEVCRVILKSLIHANNTGVITDTIWSLDCPMETLFEYIMSKGEISEEEYEKMNENI